MGASRTRVASTLLLDEHFEAGDDRFVDEVIASTAAKKLKALAERWYADPREFARRALLRYIDDGCDRPHHRPLVKALYKLAEKKGDDEVIGHFMVAFDRYVRHKLVEVPRYDWGTRQTRNALELRNETKAPRSLWSGDTESPIFSIRTRCYLRRRAFRYFRKLGLVDRARYGRAIRAALSLYRDEHLEKPPQLLDAWGLMHALYWGSPVIERHPLGVRLAPGAALADMEAAPIFPDAWQGVFEDVFALVPGARCRTVRAFAIQILKRDYEAELRGLPLARVRPLLSSQHEEVQTFGAELLKGVSGLDSLPIAAWLDLLRIENAAALEFLCEVVKKHVSPARLSLAECVDLACAKAAPVAELGLGWARQKPIKTAADVDTVVLLARAGAPRVREEAVAWAVEVLRGSTHARVEHLRDLIDARHADVREKGLALFEADPRFRDDTGLWTALAETPYDDVRAFLLRHLEARRAAFSPEALRHVWATTLLSVHRGSRSKRAALRQIADRIVTRPGEAEATLPLLGVALRSVRPPERRAALAAIAQAAFRAPALRQAIALRLPELRLFADESRGSAPAVASEGAA
jgi:alkylhydroperoxidase family enzyme